MGGRLEPDSTVEGRSLPGATPDRCRDSGELERLGGPTWFRLGDGDLAVHVERTRRLVAGETLTLVTVRLAEKFGVGTHLLPMTDDTVSTRVHTDEGSLDFQEYFVGRRAAPSVRSIEYAGAQAASPTCAVMAALDSDQLQAILICPSNPFLSIDPILAVPGMREHVRSMGVPVVGVSPLIDGLVIDEADRHWAGHCRLPTLVTSTLMSTLDHKTHLAKQTLDFAHAIRDQRLAG